MTRGGKSGATQPNLLAMWLCSLPETSRRMGLIVFMRVYIASLKTLYWNINIILHNSGYNMCHATKYTIGYIISYIGNATDIILFAPPCS